MNNRNGITETKYIAPRIELKYINETTNVALNDKIQNSNDAFELLIGLFNMETIAIYEELHLALLNRANRVIGTYMMSKGGTSGTVLDIKLVASIALKALASGIIIAHNHPSGALKPSTEDILTTKRLNEALKLFDIKILDHLIIAPNLEYYSFNDMSELI